MYSNSGISGNSITIKTNKKASEIKADVKVSEYDSLRLWGQIINCENKPVANALVKLVKVVEAEHGTKLHGVAHTISDCNGFYQFEICPQDKNCKFKVIVSKANTGPEFVHQGLGDCDPCANPPCPPYDHHGHGHHHNGHDHHGHGHHSHDLCECKPQHHHKPHKKNDCKDKPKKDCCENNYYTASNQCGCHF